MAKKDIPDEKPKVSKLPLPISDSPLVIDLPDGQKIVVGKMTSGSVIEVATWRGVGRPDSRTSRLMLGMGSGNVEEPADSAGTPATPKKPAKPQGAAVALYYLQLALNKISNLPWGKALTVFKRIKLVKPAPKKLTAGVATPAALESSVPVSAAPAITKASSVSTDSDDPDIEEWLNRISQRASKTVADREKKASSTPKKVTTVKKAAKKPSSAKSSRK